MDKKEITAMVLIDLSKAFDSNVIDLSSPSWKGSVRQMKRQSGLRAILQTEGSQHDSVHLALVS